MRLNTSGQFAPEKKSPNCWLKIMQPTWRCSLKHVCHWSLSTVRCHHECVWSRIDRFRSCILLLVLVHWIFGRSFTYLF